MGVGEEGRNLRPAHFGGGVSGDAVPLPGATKDAVAVSSQTNDGGGGGRLRRSPPPAAKKPNCLTRSMNRGIKVVTSSHDPTRRRTVDDGGVTTSSTSSSSGGWGTEIGGPTNISPNGGGAAVASLSPPPPSGPIRRASSASNKSSASSRRRRFAGSPGGGEEEKKYLAGEAAAAVSHPEDRGDYSMSREDLSIYRETFARHCAADVGGRRRRHVYVDAAVAFFERSGLGRDAIGRLWDVVARDPNGGKLDEREFAIMTHLLVCTTRRGLPAPEALPSHLRLWRDGSGVGDGEDDDGDEAYYRENVEPRTGGRPRGTVPIGPSPSAVGGGGRTKNVRDDDERMERMEREIRSLKGLVASLRIEIRDLREVVMHAGDAKHGGYSNGFPRVAPNVDTGMYAGERKCDMDSSDRTEEKRQGGHASGVPARRHSSISDAPNVDVELYWGERKDDLDASDRTEEKRHPGLDWSEKTVIPTDTSMMSSTAGMRNPMPVLARRPPSSLRNGEKKKSESKRVIPGMSQNIPFIHPPSSTSRASRKPNARSTQGMPQSRDADAMPEAASENAMGVAKPMTPADNLATQMQRVQQVEKFDTLIQTTMEKITSGDAGSKNSGGRVSWPKQVQRNRLDATSRQNSARHIRRSMIGHTQVTEVIKEFDEAPPSTAAVDLPPL